MSEENKTKKPRSKTKSAPKLWRDVAQNILDSGGKLVPSPTNPYCLKCKLHELGCKGPVAPTGSIAPKLTVLFEGVTPKEETNGLACEGSRNGAVKKHIERLAKGQNMDPASIRYVPVTRCAVHQKVKVNYNTKANWCRTFAVDDLRTYTPNLILAIGSTALGSLSHKSSAQDWSGVPLNWRGWPDDWLNNKNFNEWGHPSQIKRPGAEDWRQLRAVQAPYIIYAQQSQEVLQTWLRQLNTAVVQCQTVPEAKQYVLPHYRLIEDPDELITELDAIPDGADVDYDVETTGLHAFNKTARLTTAMLRYVKDSKPKVLIFPVEHGPMIEHLPRVLPRLARVLHNSKLSGHNIAFDIVYSSARLRPYVDLWQLAAAVVDDTRLMAYALRQSRQSLGLERLAYAWAPQMGGYEEDFVMMMESDELRPLLHPNEGGHYANALDMPAAKQAYIAYTGGDVEVVGQAKVELRAELNKTVGYGIPLADPDNLGRFKLYQTPSRKFAYDFIVKRGIRTLSRMMARGMHVDKAELEHQEDVFPKLIVSARDKLREIDPRIVAWCTQQEATVPDWKLDLENRDQLKTILFEILQLPVKRLTESGERTLGEDADLNKLPREQVLQYAAIDKFTINNLVAESPNLAPLKDYRKLYKAYTAFVRSMRNIKTEGIDKSERSKHQYLMEDCCTHPSFNQAGTDSGRISSCLPVETLVATGRGLIRLGDVVVGDVIQTDTGPRSVKTVWPRVMKPQVTLVLDCGRSITASPDHKFFIGAEKVTAGEIQVGDTLHECLCQAPFVGEYAQLAAPTQLNGRKPGLKFPRELNERLAFVLGLLSAEGYFGMAAVRPSCRHVRKTRDKARKTGRRLPVRLMCAFGWEETELRSLYIDEMKKIFGLAPKPKKFKTGLAADLCSTDICEWMVSIGMGGLAREKEVPPAVLASPRSVVISYLKGLFEGDGCSSRSCPSLTTYSANMARGVSLLLSQLGACHTLRRSVGNFGQDRPRRRRFVIGILAPSWGVARELFWSDRKINNVKVQKNKSRYFSPLYGGSRLTKVKRKKYGPDTEMVDIEVDHDDHRYLVNGILTSNSQPNCQQIPRESIIKRMYDSRFGKQDGCIFQADLSQIELRLLAAACGDPLMVDAYRRGIDLHSLTTSRVFKIPYEHFEKKYMANLQEIGKDKEAKELDRKRKIGKCVDPDTLMSVNGRIVRMGEFHSGRTPDTFYPIDGMMVQAPNGPVPIRHFYFDGFDKTKVLVCSKQGFVACTKVHKFQLIDGSLVEAQNLKVGDVLKNAVSLECGSDTPVVPFSPFDKAPRCSNFNVTVDEKLAYLLGLFYGDGCSNAGTICIATGGKEEYFAWQDAIEAACKDLGFDTKVERTVWEGTKVSGKLGPVTGSYGRVIFGSTRVSDLFIQLGAIVDDRERHRSLRLPTWLFNAKESVKLAFMGGLIDTDGSVGPTGNASMCTKSWVLAQDVAVLLRSIGFSLSMVPSWNKLYERYYFEINITTRSSVRLKPWIRLPAKKNRLREPKFIYKNEVPNAVTAVIDLPDGEVMDISVDDPHLYHPNGLTSTQTTNFLTGYGGGPFGLQTSLAEGGVYLDMNECEYIVEALFDTYPCLRKHIAYYKRFIMDNACAVSLFGRVRWFGEVRSDDQQAVSKALRAGFNHLIQASASDLMILACSAVDGLMKRAGLESILTSTVHDSMVIDARRSELPQVFSIVNEVTNNLPDVVSSMVDLNQFDNRWLYTVPLEADAEAGVSYLDQDKIIPDKITGNVDWDKLFHKWDAAKN